MEKIVEKTTIAAKKKPYSAPVIEEFGNVRQMTKSFGNKGNLDGASSGKNQTRA